MGYSTITIIGIVVAAVVRFLLGTLWYSSVLFGRAWMKSMKLDPDKPLTGGKSVLILSALASLTIAVGMSILLHSPIVGMAGDTVGRALLVGLFASIFFNFTTFLTHSPFEGRGFLHAAISYGYDLAGYLLMSRVLFFIG